MCQGGCSNAVLAYSFSFLHNPPTDAFESRLRRSTKRIAGDVCLCCHEAYDARSHDENINMIILLLIRVIDLRILWLVDGCTKMVCRTTTVQN